MELDVFIRYGNHSHMKTHEANLVFSIGMHLVWNQVPFELEWKSPVGRHDIAIKDNGKIYGIIEVKHKEQMYETKQMERYHSLRVPLVVAHWGTDINALVEQAKKWVERGGEFIMDLDDKDGLIRRRKPSRRYK